MHFSSLLIHCFKLTIQPELCLFLPGSSLQTPSLISANSFQLTECSFHSRRLDTHYHHRHAQQQLERSWSSRRRVSQTPRLGNNNGRYLFNPLSPAWMRTIRIQLFFLSRLDSIESGSPSYISHHLTTKTGKCQLNRRTSSSSMIPGGKLKPSSPRKRRWRRFRGNLNINWDSHIFLGTNHTGNNGNKKCCVPFQVFFYCSRSVLRSKQLVCMNNYLFTSTGVVLDGWMMSVA